MNILQRGALAVTTAAAISGCVGAPSDRVRQSEADALMEIQQIGGALEATITEIDLSAGLREALPGAVRASERYRAARASEREALANVNAAASARRPQASATARGGELRQSDGDRFTGFYGDFTIRQLLGDGGGTRAAIDGAAARAAGAAAARSEAANEAGLEAGRAWIELWKAQRRQALLSERYAQAEALFEQISRMSASGMIDAGTLDSARRQIVDLELERAQLRQALTAARAEFRRHFKADPEGQVELREFIGDAEALTLVGAIEGAPVLRRAAAELIAAREEVAFREAAFRPRTSIQAGANSPIDDSDPVSRTLGLVVEYPLSTGGRRSAELEAARSRAQAAEAALADSFEALTSQLHSLRAQLEAAQSAVPLARERMELAQAEAEATRSQLSTGQSSLRAVLDAEVESYRSRDRLIAAQAEASALKLAIAARTGRLSEIVGLDAPE